MIDYQCSHCGTTEQWECRCWIDEAARWRCDQPEQIKQVRASSLAPDHPTLRVVG